MEELAVALIASIAPTIAALAAWRKTKSVDDAVNHRHPEELRLFDVVKITASKVDQLSRRLDELEENLMHHVVWEEREKYTTIDAIVEAVRGRLS